jgi:hypothetical protein
LDLEIREDVKNYLKLLLRVEVGEVNKEDVKLMEGIDVENKVQRITEETC